MKKIIIIVAVVIVIALGALYLRHAGGAGEEALYEFAEVTRGDVENIVTCTGSLSAVGTVEIGTQVSGTVAEVFADFNDEVRAGTVLAVLDTTLLKTSVMDAQAGLLSAQA